MTEMHDKCIESSICTVNQVTVPGDLRTDAMLKQASLWFQCGQVLAKNSAIRFQGEKVVYSFVSTF